MIWYVGTLIASAYLVPCCGMILACHHEHNMNSTLCLFRRPWTGVEVFGRSWYQKLSFASFTFCSNSWHGICFAIIRAKLVGMVLATCACVLPSYVTRCVSVVMQCHSVPLPAKPVHAFVIKISLVSKPERVFMVLATSGAGH